MSGSVKKTAEKPRKRRLWMRFAFLICSGVVLLLLTIAIYPITRIVPAVPTVQTPTQPPNEPRIHYAELKPVGDRLRFVQVTNPVGSKTPDGNDIVPVYNYPRRTEFGRFPPISAAEVELEKILQGGDEQIDLALANWLIAASIPALRRLMTREEYFERIDQIAANVRETIQFRRAGPQGDAYAKCSTFCHAMVKLGFSYVKKFSRRLTPEESREMHADPLNIFLVGLLKTGEGNCASLPMLYVVIGQRIGLPVSLVTLKDHCFARWEEPGFRMNIEATSTDRVAVTPDDSTFLEISADLPNNEHTDLSMRSLSRRETVGELFYERSGFLEQHQSDLFSVVGLILDTGRAAELRPNEPMFAAKRATVFKHFRNSVRSIYRKFRFCRGRRSNRGVKTGRQIGWSGLGYVAARRQSFEGAEDWNVRRACRRYSWKWCRRCGQSFEPGGCVFTNSTR